MHQQYEPSPLPGLSYRASSPVVSTGGGWFLGGLWRCLVFAANSLRHPLAVGGPFASSGRLVRRTLDQVPWSRCRVLVEYGPGTGRLTAAMLGRMRPDARLLGIEINAGFVRYLRSALPDERLHVRHGSAAEVRSILAEVDLPAVDCVIAGLPFSTVGREQRQAILTETYAALRPGGSLLIYQVSTSVLPHLQRLFGNVRREFEPLNLLPTHLFHCVKPRNGESSEVPVPAS